MSATTREVLAHHLACFGKADLAGVMEDYGAESRLFYPDGLLCGPEQIRDFFVRLFEESTKAGMSIRMLHEQVDGEIAYIVWTGETAENRFELCTDTFIVRDGRIVTQTFAGKITTKR
jgi:ketosteroid isomerase-like protein